MDPKRKKILLICAGVFIGSYVVRSAGNLIAFTIYNRQRETYIAQQKAIQEARQKAAEAKKKSEDEKKQASVLAAAGAPTTIQPDPVFTRLRGKWFGRGDLSGRGICELSFELDGKLREEEDFSGYFRLNCISSQRSRLDPEAATFKGSPQNGILKLPVEKVIGRSVHGCAPTSVTLTPFGSNQMDAAWTEDTCGGDHIIVRRSMR